MFGCLLFMYRLDLTCVVYVVTLDSQNGRVPSPRKSAMHHAYDTARARDEPGPPWKSSESDEPERRLKVGRKRHTWVCRDRGERATANAVSLAKQSRSGCAAQEFDLGGGFHYSGSSVTPWCFNTVLRPPPAETELSLRLERARTAGEAEFPGTTSLRRLRQLRVPHWVAVSSSRKSERTRVKAFACSSAAFLSRQAS